MAIITGVGGKNLRDSKLAPDALGEALKLTRQKRKPAGSKHFQEFE